MSIRAYIVLFGTLGMMSLIAMGTYGITVIQTMHKERSIEAEWYTSENKCIARLVATGIPRKDIVRLRGSCANTKAYSSSVHMGE
jgi:hypothetical protein